VETAAAPPNTLAEELSAEAARLAAGPGFPAAYLARARTAAARMSVTEGGGDDVRSAALLLEQQAVIDTNVPVASRTPPQRLVKAVIRKMIGWYLRFLGHQVSLLGQAAARFGLVVADRLDRLEAEQGVERVALTAEIDALKARVAELEARP